MNCHELEQLLYNEGGFYYREQVDDWFAKLKTLSYVAEDEEFIILASQCLKSWKMEDKIQGLSSEFITKALEKTLSINKED